MSATDATSPRVPPTVFAGALLLLVIVGGLISYKAGGAMSAIAKVEAGGTIVPKQFWFEGASWTSSMASLVHAVNYLGWVFIALAFGILIGAAVKTLLPKAWIAKTLAAPGARGQLFAGLSGAPLMLCSCCATPIFEGVYNRTGRLGPSLAVLLAPPMLNPAALILTFMLFPSSMGIARLIASLFLVSAGAAWVGKRFSSPVEPQPSGLSVEPESWTGLIRAFRRSLLEVAARSLPAILIDIVLSAFLISNIPIPSLVGQISDTPLLLIATLVALLIALPTFAEIPIGLALMHAGAPDAVVVAVLIAGPAVNLPSLFGVAKLTSARIGLATASVVFAVSVTAGLVI